MLEAVFLEAMRLYPPAPNLMRIATRRVKLGDVELGPGATINVPIYVVHRHRRLWQDPLRFDPSRFGPEARAARVTVAPICRSAPAQGAALAGPSP